MRTLRVLANMQGDNLEKDFFTQIHSPSYPVKHEQLFGFWPACQQQEKREVLQFSVYLHGHRRTDVTCAWRTRNLFAIFRVEKVRLDCFFPVAIKVPMFSKTPPLRRPTFVFQR